MLPSNITSLCYLISDMIDQALKNEKVARTAARERQRKVLVLGEWARCKRAHSRLTTHCYRTKASDLVKFTRIILTLLIRPFASESGKTTLIKQLRLISSPEAFAIERESWRRSVLPHSLQTGISELACHSIVFLNVVRSILTMIDIVSPHFNLHNPQDYNSQEFARLRLRLTVSSAPQSTLAH